MMREEWTDSFKGMCPSSLLAPRCHRSMFFRKNNYFPLPRGENVLF